jgi:hypothetical protein
MDIFSPSARSLLRIVSDSRMVAGVSSGKRQGSPRSLFDRIGSSSSLPLVDGAPPVDRLPTDLVERFGEPYMRRHFLLGGSAGARGSTARFHQLLTSDGADMHDHPWDFVSVILAGRYVETTPDGEREFGPGSVLVRRAEDVHRLTLPDGPVWTFVTLGPARRRWGFHTAAGWVHWRDYVEREVHRG